MKHPVTDEELERGLVVVNMLPEQAEMVERLLVLYGSPFRLGPPMHFGTEEDGTVIPERVMVIDDPEVFLRRGA